MIEILNTILPIILITLSGYIIVKFKRLNDSEIAAINKVVFNYFVPVLLFKSFSSAELPETFQWEYLSAYYISALFIYFLAVLIGIKLFDHSLKESGIFGLGAAYSNTVLIGIPVCYSIFGNEGLLPLFIIISVHSAILFSVTTIVICISDRQSSLLVQLNSLFKSIIFNPIIASLFLGLVFNILKITLPISIQSTLEITSKAALPCSLFVLGASLCKYQIKSRIPETIVMTVLKIIIFPIIVWVMVFKVFSIPHLWASVAVLNAAMPVGVNVYVFAREHESCEESVAASIVISTIISFGIIAWLIAYIF